MVRRHLERYNDVVNFCRQKKMYKNEKGVLTVAQFLIFFLFMSKNSQTRTTKKNGLHTKK